MAFRWPAHIDGTHPLTESEQYGTSASVQARDIAIASSDVEWPPSTIVLPDLGDQVALAAS